MKPLFLFSLIILLFSCKEKTAETSKYSTLISELTESYMRMDSNYNLASQIDFDSIKSIMNTANEKYGETKKVYKTDTIDLNVEKIMAVVRGQLYKKNKGFKSKFLKTEEEYKKTQNQYNTLKKNLIHETLEEDKAKEYTGVEKHAMFLLNGEFSGFIQQANSTFSQYKDLYSKMDSIIKVNETK